MNKTAAQHPAPASPPASSNSNQGAAKKVAVITGGTRGIGRAISLRLARSGYTVVALYARDRSSANELEQLAEKESLEIQTIRGDLTKGSSFKEIVEQITKSHREIHAIIHSAASGVHKPAMELSLKHLRWTFEINVFSIHNLLRSLVPFMPEDSRIVGITSNGGTHVIPYYAAIGSSKGALESLFRHYARELSVKKISVNLVCPGMVLTDAVDAFPDKDHRISRTTEETPTKKLTETDEISELVGFLCTSKVGAQIIGQTLTVDGGKGLLS